MRSILVVDDTELNVGMLIAILRDHYQVRVAKSGELALLAVERQQPDLILLDVMMPGLDGFTVCRMLKANPATEHIPVIFMTGLSTPGDKRMGYDCGAVDYVTKPFVAFRVQDAVARALMGKQDA